MPSIKKSYIGSTLGSTNTPLGEVEVTPPDVPTPRAHYDETSITYGTGTVSGRWDNIGWETDTIWHISDANNVNDPGQAVINGINAVVTELSRIRTPMNTTTIAQEWNVFFVIEPSADVTTGQGIADARSLRTGALQLYILNEEMIFAVEDGPGDLRLEARPEAQVVWMRCMGQAGDSTFQVTTAVDVRSVSGPLNDVVHAWLRIFNGLGSPVGQAHYPGKIGEIVLHETLTVDQGQAVVNRLANKWLNEVPLWSDVPDATVDAGIEYNINMNLWVDGRGELLFNWVLNGGVTGVTIDQNGVITIETNVLPQTLSLSVTVENIHGASTSNTFDWVLEEDTSPPAPVWIQQPEDQLTNENDLPGTYDVSELVFSFVPLTWAVTAPATIDTNGVISINTAVGVYPLTVTATNETGSTDSDEFDWTIEEGGTPPVWSDVPDNYINVDDLPTTVDMNQWVTGDNLTGWALSGNPSGVTIDSNTGIVTVDDTVPASRFTMSCYVENSGGNDTSNAFTWLVADVPSIDTQPNPLVVIEPLGGSFTVEASHPDTEANLFYQWEAEPDSGSGDWFNMEDVYSDVSTTTSPTTTVISTGFEEFTLSPINTRCRVRAYLSDLDEFETYTNVVTCTINRVPPTIDTQPIDKEVTAPEGTTFEIEASHPSGAELFYLWEASDDGDIWFPPQFILSDVDIESINTPQLIINSTSVGEADNPPQWSEVSDNQIPESNEATYSRNMKNYVFSSIPITNWSTTWGNIDSEGIFTPPGGTGISTNPIIITAENNLGEEDSNEWNLVIVADPPVSDNLLDITDFTYVGSFIPPRDAAWSGNTLAIEPNGTGLYIGSRIPEPLLGIGKCTLPGVDQTADWIIEPVEITGESNPPQSLWHPRAAMVHNGRIIISKVNRYDNNPDSGNTHLYADLNLTTFSDMFTADYASHPFGKTFVGGYMCQIPPEWQEAFGGPCLLGNGAMSIISFGVNGYSFMVFDPDNVGVIEPFPINPAVYWNYDNPMRPRDTFYENEPEFQGQLVTGANDVWQYTDSHTTGIVFPEGTSTVLTIGRNGYGDFTYKDEPTCSGDNGANPYRRRILAFNANHILAALNGEIQPWDVEPYGNWDLPGGPTDFCSGMTPGGLAYDTVNRRIYYTYAYEDNPEVHMIDVAELL